MGGISLLAFNLKMSYFIFRFTPQLMACKNGCELDAFTDFYTFSTVEMYKSDYTLKLRVLQGYVFTFKTSSDNV